MFFKWNKIENEIDYNLFPEWTEYLCEIKDKKRRYQSFIARCLLAYAVNKNNINYSNFTKTDSGRWEFSPKSGATFSITHTENLVAVAISKSNDVGVDAEKIQDKIIAIKKYLHISEAKSLEELTILWTKKECVYKLGSPIEKLYFESKKITNDNEEFIITTTASKKSDIEFIELKEEDVYSIPKKE